ncbi:unnamed protein product [Closterium sp. NIES-65]|nr:unnamed protein product [Closterium sp. NIES-65]
MEPVLESRILDLRVSGYEVVREHYLRDDIPCGALPCAKAPATACDKESARLSPNNETILVIDTNVALHQIDLLENAAISNVVVEVVKLVPYPLIPYPHEPLTPCPHPTHCTTRASLIDLFENVAISNVVELSVLLEEANIDLLENAAISNVVVLSVVLEEVKSRNVAVYGRLRALVAEESRRFFVFSNEHHKDTYIKAEPGESPNDRNDRETSQKLLFSLHHSRFTLSPLALPSSHTPCLTPPPYPLSTSLTSRPFFPPTKPCLSLTSPIAAIRVAAQWYQQHLGGKVPVVLITDDKANLAKAVAGGTKAMRVREYVASLGSVELMDLVVSAGDGEEAEGGEGGEGDKAAREEENRGLRTNVSRSKRKRIYSDHKPMSAITAGLQRGLYHQGKLRVSRYNCFEAFVGSESLGDEILVIGRCDMNRAVDGDVVAVELLPRDQWKEPTSGALREREDDHDDAAAEEHGEEDSVGLPPASADDAPSTLSSAAAALSLDKEGDSKEEGGGGGGGKDGGGGEGGKGPSELARPTGRVVGIIKRNWRT